MLRHKSTLCIPDRLYDDMHLASWVEPLLHAVEMRRLRSVQISIPHEVLPTSACASRFEHSMGVAFLAQVVGHRTEFQHIERELMVAALLHDVGTPPFSHCSEPVMEHCLGYSHEEASVRIVDRPKMRRTITECGASCDVVRSLLNGSLQPFCQLISGSPDVDNLENTLRYARSMGLRFMNYEPLLIARAFCLAHGRICIEARAKETVRRWTVCRQRVYEAVYAEPQQSAYSMLRRAVYLAAEAGQLTDGFFEFSDAQALVMLSRCQKDVQRLMDKLYHWLFYKEVVCEPVSLTLLKTLQTNALADDIASQLAVNPALIVADYSKGRGHKPITTPFLLANGTLEMERPVRPSLGGAKLHVFVDASLNSSASRIREYVLSRIRESSSVLV